jgi:hypothetical protein
MDERLGRFKYCDPRLYPYLDRVFSRLPPDFREEILNDHGFQFISDATLPDVCGHCFVFDQPLKTLIYLNPAIIKQPDHRLECSIALELAEYATNKEKRNGDRQRVQELLINWGFEKEVDAVCFCSAVAGSKVFKFGYDWARGQSEDYLMLHFGIYFDEWNHKGLVRMPKERLENLRSQASQNRLLPAAAMREEKELPQGFTVDEVFIEGVMAAVKEIKMQGRVEA